MRNFWLDRLGKNAAKREIEWKLAKFIGRESRPAERLFEEMRKIVIKYFKNNTEKLKYFSDGNGSFNYHFEIKEYRGHITEVTFEC